MQYLFDEWDSISRRLESVDHILFLSDYDGTLTPIVDRPELAVLNNNTRKLLRKLVKNRRYTIGIISGRALSDLKSKIGLEGIIYAGNHGLEIEVFGSSFLEPIAEEMRPFLSMLNKALSATMRGIKGVFVENKGLTLSVHYRMVKGAEERKVQDAFEKIIGPLHVTGKIKVTHGKKVYEIRPPVDWNKGKAVAWLAARIKDDIGKTRVMPIYLGDDLTDEDAFELINREDGISIFVGDEDATSGARYLLKSPEEVTEFLKML
jgi:trehalose 6-phosphate phosphatase